MIRLTTEQAQQIEEALVALCNSLELPENSVNALNTIRAARAQEQAEQEPVAYFLDVKAGFSSKPLYEQVSDEYKNDADVFPLYAAPQPVSQEYQDHLVNQSFDWAAMAAKHQFMEGYRIGLAEMREKCAVICEAKQSYSAMHANTEFAAVIRSINFEGDTGFRPVSEMIAEHKQDPKKAAAIEKAKLRKAEQEPSKQQEALQELKEWQRAYPLSVFPEPDCTKAQQALESVGMTLDSLSASTLRWALDRVMQIVEKALEQPNCQQLSTSTDNTEHQEPVAVVEITYGREPECYVTGNIDDFPEGVFKLYAAPVQQADQELVACNCGTNPWHDCNESEGCRIKKTLGISSRPVYDQRADHHKMMLGYEIATKYGVFENKAFQLCDKMKKLYAAPAQTKDLTGQDLCDLEVAVGWKGDSYDFEVIAKAVIAKFKEKNK